jgi:hypothetical protein
MQDDLDDISNSRYYLVIVQYAGRAQANAGCPGLLSILSAAINAIY